MAQSYPLESSAPEVIIVGDYELALKLFMNRDFEKSFNIIEKLHDHAYRNYEKGILSEAVFVKILTLYMTEVGLILNPRQSFGSTILVPRPKKKSLISDLEKNSHLDKLHRIYGSLADVPLELLYQIFLVYYTCEHVIRPEDNKFLPDMFRKVYHIINFASADSSDRYLKRWVDMFVFNVLPDVDDFSTAFELVRTNPLLNSEKATAKLKEIQELKTQEKRLREKAAKEGEAREAKRIAAENAAKKKEKEAKNLKYMSLKQIKKGHEEEKTPETRKDLSGSAMSLDRVRERLLSLVEFLKNYANNNSPFLLVLVVLALIGTRYLRTRRINLREKLKETMQMAFKVTYV